MRWTVGKRADGAEVLINTTRSTRGGSGWNRDRVYGVSDPSRADRSDASARNRNAAALNPPDFDRSIPVTDLVMDDSRAVSAAVDAETLALREEVERLRRAAAEETEECGFEDGYEGGQPFDEPAFVRRASVTGTNETTRVDARCAEARA